MATFKVYLRETLAQPLQKEPLPSGLCFIPRRAPPPRAASPTARTAPPAAPVRPPPPRNSPLLRIKMGKELSLAGRWREPSPVGFQRCVLSPGTACSALSEVAHGGFYPVKKSYEEGDVVHFFCDKHYSVTGFDSVQCYNFGWYPDPPVCEGTLFL